MTNGVELREHEKGGKSQSADVERPDVFFCRNCEIRLDRDTRYCPNCGNRRKGIRIRPLRGFTVLYVMLTVMSILALLFGFRVHDEIPAVGNVLFALGTALGPVALVGLVYEHLLKDSLKEAALTSYADFSEHAFQTSLNQLASQTNALEDAAKRLAHIHTVGLIGAFPERRHAFPYVESAIAAEHKRITIVGTSFRGLLWPSPGEERIMELLRGKIQEGLCEVRFILTHPAFAHLRQSLEGIQRKETFHIAQEILDTVEILKRAGVPATNIRFVRGTPTVFGLMTGSIMLLNPYPLQRQAFTSLALVLDAKDGENLAYRAFEQSHFMGVWEGRNVDVLDGFDIRSLQKVFEQSLNSLTLCESDKRISYDAFDNP